MSEVYTLFFVSSSSAFKTFCNTDLGKMFNKLQNIVVKKYRCANLNKTEKKDETA